jgi:hypothetical protein
MSGILRRDAPVVGANGQFTRAWYDSITGTQQDTNGLVSGVTLYVDTGVVNLLVIATGATALKRGTIRYVKPAFTNTSTTVTLNDSGLGFKPVVLSDGSLPAVGQIQATVTIQLQYDGSAWEIVNLSTASQTIPGNLIVGGTTQMLGTGTVTGAFRAISTTELDGLATLKGLDSTVADEAANALPIGFKGRPQVIRNANASFALSDRSKHWYHNDGSAYTWTIPANTSVAFPVGTELDLVCKASGAVNITLAITTDTLVWMPTGGTGSRTFGQYARGRLLKTEATIWTLDGVGIT